MRLQFRQPLDGAEEAILFRRRDDAFGECAEFAYIVGTGERPCAERMRVGDGQLFLDYRAVTQGDDYAAAEGLFLRIAAVVAARPFEVFDSGDLDRKSVV